MGYLRPLLWRVLRFDVLDCRSTCGSSSSASPSESPTLVDLLLTATSSLMTLGSSALSMVRLLQVHCTVRSDVPPTMAPVALRHPTSSSSTSTTTTSLYSTKLYSSPLLSSLSSASSSCTLSTTGSLSRLTIISLGQQLQVGRDADRFCQPAWLSLSDRHAQMRKEGSNEPLLHVGAVITRQPGKVILETRGERMYALVFPLCDPP